MSHPSNNNNPQQPKRVRHSLPDTSNNNRRASTSRQQPQEGYNITNASRTPYDHQQDPYTVAPNMTAGADRYSSMRLPRRGYPEEVEDLQQQGVTTEDQDNGYSSDGGATINGGGENDDEPNDNEKASYPFKSALKNGYPQQPPQAHPHPQQQQQPQAQAIPQRPKMGIRRTSSFQTTAPTPKRTDIEGQFKKPGFFGKIRNGVKKFCKDEDVAYKALAEPLHYVSEDPPAPEMNKDGQWAGNVRSQRAPQNLYEEALYNNDTAETYLSGDELENQDDYRQPFNNLIEGVTGSPPGRRKSYAERRKTMKHVVTHCRQTNVQYQRFIYNLSRALITFGSPSHRIEAQLNSLITFFDIPAQFVHFPGTIILSFGDPDNKAANAEIVLVRANQGMGLNRIHQLHEIYRKVLHDDMYASEGTERIRELMKAPKRYNDVIGCILSFFCSLLICGIAFGGSINDMWFAGFLGLFVRWSQNYIGKTATAGNGSLIFITALVSFAARAISSYHTQIWCYSAISSAAVIPLLPGFLILAGVLDIANKNAPLGSPKIVTGILTSLYLAFGLTLGSDIFLLVVKGARQNLDNWVTNNPAQYMINGCYRSPDWAWYVQPIPWWSLFFCVPLFAFFASMNNQQHWADMQMVVIVLIASASFALTRLANVHLGLANHPDYVAFIGSFVIGILGNAYSRKYGGTAFNVMLTAVLLLVPDGLAAAGGLSDNYQSGSGQDEYTQVSQLALKMLSVITGISGGVYLSCAIIYMFGKKKNAALLTF